MSDHGLPEPPNEKKLVDHTTAPASDHTHEYIVPNHTHSHTGWKRWAQMGFLVFIVLLASWQVWRVEQASNKADRLQLQLIEQVANDCVDRRGDVALRTQWERIYHIIEAQRAGKVDRVIAKLVPGTKVGDKLKPDEAGKAFAESYSLARKEAGAAPPCIGELPEINGG